MIKHVRTAEVEVRAKRAYQVTHAEHATTQ